MHIHLLIKIKKSNCLFKLVLCLLSILSLSSFAQSQFDIQQLDNSSGLSNSCVNIIYEDTDGFIWFGTWDGLNVYDGSAFKVFNYNQLNSGKSIGSNVIYDLGEDKNKNIWIATIEGVSRLEKRTGNFKHFFYNGNKDVRSVAKGYLLSIDHRGEVYSTLKSEKTINYYNLERQEFEKCIIEGGANLEITKIHFDAKNRLWILYQNGYVEVFKTDKNKLKLLKSIKSERGISDLFYLNNKMFFITNQKELYQVNDLIPDRKVVHLPYAIRSISYYKGKYLLAWSSKGIGEYNKEFKPTNVLINDFPGLVDMRVTTLFRGDNNLFWIGTDGNGVLKVSENRDNFGLVNKVPEGRKINIPVRAFNEIDGDLWIGTKGNGIIKIKDFGTPKAKSTLIKNFYSVSDLLDNCVYAIQKDNNQYTYVGSDALGVTIYDNDLKKWFKWNEIIGSWKYPEFSSVHCILTEDDGSIWMGLEAYGLIHLKIIRNKDNFPEVSFLRRYPYTGDEKGPGNNVIYSLETGKRNEILVGCRYGGLSVFNKDTKTFLTINALSYDGSLSNNDVLSLYKDKKDVLWIGTSYGLNYIKLDDLQKAKPIFSKLTTEEGLPNNTIHAITEDKSGEIWASTNKGLMKLNSSTKEVVRFRQSDGLQSNEFSDGAVWKDSLGNVFFGGIYGFNYFNPEKVNISQKKSNLFISDFQLGGSSVIDGLNTFKVIKAEGEFESDEFSLERSTNYFDLTVKAINFSNIEKYQYAYMLEGNDKDWRHTGEDGKISYSNIPPGKYNFKLKWSNGDGVWTADKRVFSLEVKQYLWLTWPAFLIYLIAISGAAYMFYLYRKNRTEMKYKLEMEHMLRLKDDELHQKQVNFFTNITHEIQTPITLIMGALERFLHKNENSTDASYIKMMHQQASRLSYLVQQLLEFRRFEEGYASSYYSFLNVSNLMVNISGLFYNHGASKKLDFNVDIQPDVKIWVDKDKVEKIIFNLLSNAFKHTAFNQKIKFIVETEKESKKLNIRVLNSGCDLDAEEIDQVFDRFFVKDDTQINKVSSGIGLAFTKELVDLIGGRITVDSNDGWIEFKLTLSTDFVPMEENILNGVAEKDMERPSSLMTIITEENVVDTKNINKETLLASLENKEKKSILIVEDEPSIRYLLKDIFSDTYHIYEAENGLRAMEVVKNIIPNIIVSDVMMPDMSGLELCSIIKNTPDTCHIPFVILSARGTIEQQTEGYDLGADAYIPKPFNNVYLLVRVRKLLEYREKLNKMFSDEQSKTYVAEAGMKESDKNLIESIFSIVEENMDKPDLDSAFLEDKLALSKMQLYRKLKSLSNMTPNEFIKNIRLKQAALLLKSSDFNVSEIFYQTGFNNQSYFFREFKKMYHCSPSEYRAQQRIKV